MLVAGAGVEEAEGVVEALAPESVAAPPPRRCSTGGASLLLLEGIGSDEVEDVSLLVDGDDDWLLGTDEDCELG